MKERRHERSEKPKCLFEVKVKKARALVRTKWHG